MKNKTMKRMEMQVQHLDEDAQLITQMLIPLR